MLIKHAQYIFGKTLAHDKEGELASLSHSKKYEVGSSRNGSIISFKTLHSLCPLFD